MGIEETSGGEMVTSKYNELRTKEYAHLRQRFYELYPKSLESDTNFEDDVFLYIEQLQKQIGELQKGREQALEEPKLCICCEEITEENAHLHRNCGK